MYKGLLLCRISNCCQDIMIHILAFKSLESKWGRVLELYTDFKDVVHQKSEYLTAEDVRFSNETDLEKFGISIRTELKCRNDPQDSSLLNWCFPHWNAACLTALNFRLKYPKHCFVLSKSEENYIQIKHQNSSELICGLWRERTTGDGMKSYGLGTVMDGQEQRF